MLMVCCGSAVQPSRCILWGLTGGSGMQPWQHGLALMLLWVLLLS
jgi:hypothetical protein